MRKAIDGILRLLGRLRRDRRSSADAPETHYTWCQRTYDIGINSYVVRGSYAIVAGVPARIIRYRFDEVTVRRLLASRWWDYPPEFIANELVFDDIEQCLRALEKNRHLLEQQQ